jgi:hypothetical protein
LDEQTTIASGSTTSLRYNSAAFVEYCSDCGQCIDCAKARDLAEMARLEFQEIVLLEERDERASDCEEIDARLASISEIKATYR